MGFFSKFFKTDPEVDYQLALRAESFDGDYKKAAWLYKKAAEAGHANAQFYLGFMLFRGKGVAENLPLALDYIKKAAEQNNFKAEFLLAEMYYSGEGVEKNIEEGDKWMAKFNKHGKDVDKLSFLKLT